MWELTMTDQGAEGVLSPYLRRKRIQAVAPWLKGRVLDFGCGAGMLATLVDCEKYLGVEIDELSLQQARKQFSKHQFVPALPERVEKFDTVVALAVIEHVSEPAAFLFYIAGFMEVTHLSRLVVTTPHPSVGWVHNLGAKIGIFSKHANEEHEDLLNRSRLELVGNQAGLKLRSYSRFLFGANQIAVYSKRGV
jgi:2-polyprenyl-3-methyl-5-hydroxy-6-metoxy-1,4-benzoquinol methylase